MSETVNIRELALLALLEMQEEGRQSHRVIRSVLDKYQYLPKQDRAFFSRLCQGTLEYRPQLDYILNQYSSVKTTKMKPVIREILRMAVYQLYHMDQVPESAAVNEAVKLAVKKGFRSLKGFVNGVLRTVIREKKTLKFPGEEQPLLYLEVCGCMPEYLAKKWMDAYGFETAVKICSAFLEEKPITVRLRDHGDPLKRKTILEELKDSGIAVQAAPYMEQAVILKHVNSLAYLPAFYEGRLQVQDVSSMLAVECAGITPGQTILDLCAAPGGKSIAAADAAGEAGRVIARDLTEYKTELIRQNLHRCGIGNVTVEAKDAAVMDPGLEGRMDVVLADVPCSGYGVIGRKPDIKYRASRENQQELVQLQRAILKNAAACVRPGGVLLFSTCTIAAEENEENVRFIREELDLMPESLDPWLPEELRGTTTAEGYLQLLPDVHAGDGFFIARFRKRTV
ncbi:MAG: 16S rRNA (cytosine(967)-C(5))-methyltransferase RsmB [Lachnospiraceae bacterium]|nr:16S rRNA (cytosine(967)-C(5))-methyltransferase RsmB [Lachnospiraceae bacterium]